MTGHPKWGRCETWINGAYCGRRTSRWIERRFECATCSKAKK